jgi:ElaB/YqjD/DUF883 family membrane-anchored ribosome-binding protein
MSTIDSAKIKDAAGAVVDSVLSAKQSAEDLAHSLSTKVTEVKSHSADKLQSGAESVRRAAERGSAAAETVAEKLDAASSYIRQFDTRSLAADLRQTVKRYPLGSMVVGVLVGVYVGTLITRRNKIAR